MKPCGLESRSKCNDKQPEQLESERVILVTGSADGVSIESECACRRDRRGIELPPVRWIEPGNSKEIPGFESLDGNRATRGVNLDGHLPLVNQEEVDGRFALPEHDLAFGVAHLIDKIGEEPQMLVTETFEERLSLELIDQTGHPVVLDSFGTRRIPARWVIKNGCILLSTYDHSARTTRGDKQYSTQTLGPSRHRMEKAHTICEVNAIKDTLDHEPDWPIDGRPVVFLGDASSALERRLIEEWAERRAGGAAYDLIWLPPSRRARRSRYADPILERRLRVGDDALFVPLRVAWLPPERQGKRSVTLVDLLKFGDPRDPDPIRQYLTLSRSPDKCRIVVGLSASTEELLAAHKQSVEIRTPGEFVVHRAWLALERAERKLRGNRYKVPKFVAEDLTGSQEFLDTMAKVAENEGRSIESARRRARRYIAEIAASHSPLVIDLIANAIHWLYRQGYGAIHYNEQEIRPLYELGQDHPLVFLPSHKSQLDRLVLQYLLWENDLPPNHTAGGINLNFFPVGQLIRRTGVFFIRRSFKDNDLYKHVLTSYIDYLVEKRFPLEWYLEGGRSRSGKLLPPRFGMLAYVVDAHARGKSDDVYLIPTSIAYDQIFDVGSYAAEQRGTDKQSESFGWLIDSIRTLRRRYGDIYIRFGEPISMKAECVPDASPDTRSLNVQKLAFKVLRGVNKVTPITPTSVVTIALLANEERAMTVEEIREELRGLVGYILRRRLPTTERVRFGGTAQVKEVLDRLREHNIVTRFNEGPVPVYRIQDEQYLAAAYYRNTIVHYFIIGAIAELALLHAAESDQADVTDAFWQEAMRLRDLLKFEFFFSDKESFVAEVRAEVSRFRENWESSLREGPGGARDLLGRLRPLRAHWALGPFLEAYLVVGDALESRPHDEPFEAKEFLAACLGLGEQYRLQQRITKAEAVSQVLFKSALGLAGNRRLLDNREGIAAERSMFAAEIRDVVRRIDVIETLAAGQRVGLH